MTAMMRRANRVAHFATVAFIAVLTAAPAAVGQVCEEQIKVIASDGGGFDLFGRSVALSGDTMLVGQHADDIPGQADGAAYVFVRSGRPGSVVWTEQAKLTHSNIVGGGDFGHISVALSGDTAVVGRVLTLNGNSGGAAYVFVRTGDTWTEQATLTASDAPPYNAFGYSVAVWGDTAIVGSLPYGGTGAAYVFVRSGPPGSEVWTQQTKLVASDPPSGIGYSMALEGDMCVAGASNAAYVFVRNGTTWIQEAKLTASNSIGFGRSVAISGDTAVVGAPGVTAGYVGSAYVFVRSRTLREVVWIQQAELIRSGASPNDRFGWAVSASGNTALVGTPGASSAYVFVRSDAMWNQRARLRAFDGANFGWSVALSGDRAVVGAQFDSNSNGFNAGAVYVCECVSLACEVLDPNPVAVSGEIVWADPPERLAALDNHVDGLAADGVTLVVLRQEVFARGEVEFRISDENGSTADIGGLSARNDQRNWSSSVIAPAELLSDGRRVAFAILKAPLDFTRGNEDFALTTRPLVIETTFTPSGAGQSLRLSRELHIGRPPVVLLHGLWSDQTTWEQLDKNAEFLWTLRHDPRFVVHAEDYRYTHAAALDTNRLVTRVGIRSAVQVMREMGFAATQADVIGHSMGGILARRHVSPGPLPYTYKTNKNFMQGDIHKLITIGTPHKGTPMVCALINEFNEIQPLGLLFEAAQMCVTCGAVRDLRRDVLALDVAVVPCHAIVAIGGSDIIDLVSDFQQLPPPIRWLYELLNALGVFDVLGREHDVIVPAESQAGGLIGAHQTRVGANLSIPRFAVHTTETSESAFDVRAIELLQTRLTDGIEFAESLPAQTASASCWALSRQNAEFAGRGIEITEPQPRTELYKGRSVVMTVEAIKGFEPERVLLLSGNDARVLTTPPFTAELQIPTDWIGPSELHAVAFDMEGNMIVAEPVVVNIVGPNSFSNLSISPTPIYLFGWAPTRAISVHACDESVCYDISQSGIELHYFTFDSAVATVSENGVVTSAGVGETTLRVWLDNNLNPKDKPKIVYQDARVIVVDLPCPGDIAPSDGNGQVDIDDLLLIIKLWGVTGAPGSLQGDVSVNGIVDIDDLLEIIGHWGACP